MGISIKITHMTQVQRQTKIKKQCDSIVIISFT